MSFVYKPKKPLIVEMVQIKTTLYSWGVGGDFKLQCLKWWDSFYIF